MNISRQRQKELLFKLKETQNRLSKVAEGNDSAGIVELLSELEQEIRRKKYGLVFEQHREAMRNTLEAFVPVLSEEKELMLGDGKIPHILIEGDNFAALHLLQDEYNGKIDLIYIDPPYNTGKKDLTYKDDYLDSHDEFRHSSWLSFMESRLRLARSLLAESGIIFLSIDGREMFVLKLLCDDIFGEENFISCVSCQANPGGKKSKGIESTIQYLLVFAKNQRKSVPLGTYAGKDSRSFPFLDEKGRYRRGNQLEKWGEHDTIRNNPRLAYSIYYNPENDCVRHLFDYNLEELEKNRNAAVRYLQPNPLLLAQGYVCIRPRRTNAEEYGRWRLEPDTFYKRLAENGFIFRNTGKGYKIYEKEREKGARFIRTKDFIPGEIARQESRELAGILGTKAFDYPKPLAFMKHIIGMYQKKDAVVLDFFAGSGTTGHAVMELNAQDGGKRRFILCTNNENGICRDIAYERLRVAITGKRRNGTLYSKGLDASLKYFRIDYFPKEGKPLK